MHANRPLARLSSYRFLALLFSFALISATAKGQEDHAKLNQVLLSGAAVKPGTHAMFAVVLDIKPGFHAQSSTPSNADFYKFRAKLDPIDGMKAGDAIFPAGEDKEYPLLGQLNVYTGKVIVRFPLTVPQDAKPGEVKIKGSLGYQICDDKVCYPPEKTLFDIVVKVVGAAEEIKPANEEVFKGFLAQPTTKPTTGPSSKPAADLEGRVEIDAVLNRSALQAGKPAMLAVVLDIKPGFHAQSHAPSDPNYKATIVEMNPISGVTFGTPLYPPGQNESYAGGVSLSVYSGRAIVQIPITVSDSVSPGMLAIAGTVTVQICDDRGVCFRPQKLPFEITATLAAAGTAVTANHAEIFAAAAAMAVRPAPELAQIATPVDPPMNLLPAFGLAFLVGILFNVVPCVLPVLPLKAIGFYETANHNRLKSMSFGLAFSFGIMASFAVLGLLVVVLKTFTWGELFANAYFKLALVIILVAMALNMFGLFTVNLPQGAYMFSPRHDTYFGNFLYGILTAALSTPCTFGYFVTVLTTALLQPPLIGLLLIVMVGAGMSFPFVVLSALPELARKFPRTGPWAEVVRQFMGFMLLAVAIYFAQTFIGAVIAEHNVYWLIFAVNAAAAIFLVIKAYQHGKTPIAMRVAIPLALIIIVGSFWAVRKFAAQPYQWQPYAAERLADARSQKKLILIDFTASWCANCKTVEAFVLNTPEVQDAVRSHQVEMIKADLTDTAAPGWGLLKNELKAEGIPLTAIYSPNLDQPIRLPGIYSVNDLLSALDQAAHRKTALK